MIPTVVMMTVVIMSNLLNLIAGGSICGVVSVGGEPISFDGSFIGHHHYH